LGSSGTSSFGSVQFIPGTGFVMNLNLQPGKNYRVQYNANLATTNWNTLTNFTSAGTALQIVDPAVAANRWYRVISP
jgi:hypothetical protein